MKHLFLHAIRNRRHAIFVVATLVTMLALSIASQLEICALAVMANKGPDFFQLFAPEGKVRSERVYRDDVNARWLKIDKENKGFISKTDSQQYLAKQKRFNFVDRMVAYVDQSFHTSQSVANLAILLIAIALFKAASLFGQRYFVRLVAIRVSRDLRQDYFEHLQTLPMTVYQKYNIGSLSTRVVGDALAIAESINAFLLNYIQTPFTVIFTLVICFLTSWKLSLIVFCGLPLIVFPIIYLAKQIKRIAKQLQKNQENFASVLIDFLAGIQTIKMFAMEEFSLKKYSEQNQRMALLEQKSARYDNSSRPVIHTIAMFFLATSLLYGLYVFHMAVAELFFFCGCLYLFYEPIKKFAETNNSIQRGIAAAERMFEVMKLSPQADSPDGAIPLKSFNDTIEFNDVWFRYEDEWVLKGISFKVCKGDVVAITGPTGAGKSTIVQLLPRLYEVQKGTITIDGKSIGAYSQRSLRENIAFVPQKPFLFLDTVSENIAFGRPFSVEEIQEAAQRAHAHEFIMEMPQKYDTVLSEAGKNLSGGQQQRLAIARALVKGAPILIMDEATSSLDTVSENQIKEAINQLKGKVTQIIIAHRLSTIEDADNIIYIDHGQVLAQGTKEELLESCPGFRLMWEMMHKNH